MKSKIVKIPVSLERLGRESLIWAKKKSLNATCVQTQSGGGDGGIRTHVPISRQNDFESFSLRPLRYVSIYKFTADAGIVCH